jgi:hypothetical protein
MQELEMKSLKLICLMSVAGLALGVSAAQAAPVVTGTIQVTGSVTPTCSVSGGGAVDAGSWGGPIALGELDDPTTGLLSSALTGSTAQGNTVTVSVMCNSASPNVTLSASPLANVATATTGYTNSVGYTARIDIGTSPSGTFTDTYVTGSGAASPVAVNAPLSTSANNTTISVNSLTATGVLVSGSYTGTISITISPT